MPLIVKTTYNGVTRRIPLHHPPTLPTLQAELWKHFNPSEGALITYTDEDGDIVAFTTDAELAEQVTIANNNVLRVCIQPAKPSSSSPIASTQPPASPQLEALTAGVADLVSALRHSAQPPAKRPCARGARAERSLPLRLAPDARPPHGLFSGIRPLFSAFPPRKELGTNLRAVNIVTRKKFREVAHAVKKSDQRMVLLSGLSASTPALREFISDIPDDALPDDVRVNALVSNVEQSLKNTDSTVVPRITEFIKIAASDKALVGCLRLIKDVPLMPWEQGFVKSSVSPRRFDTHQVKCAGCDKSPIVGTRYECTTEKRNLCSYCYGKAEMKKDLEYRPLHYVWEKNCENMKAPPAPLVLSDRSNNVKFLHKVLTDLGYMNSSMYARRPGMFSEKSKKAVAAFQSEHALAAEIGMYDETTAAHLARVVTQHEATTGTAAADSTMEGSAPVAQDDSDGGKVPLH